MCTRMWNYCYNRLDVSWLKQDLACRDFEHLRETIWLHATLEPKTIWVKEIIVYTVSYKER